MTWLAKSPRRNDVPQGRIYVAYILAAPAVVGVAGWMIVLHHVKPFIKRQRNHAADAEAIVTARKARSCMQSGRASLRCFLHMPTLVALRINPDIRRKYQAPKDAGKASKAAIIAIMRKLIMLANTLIRDNRTWNPNVT